jgi:hypothetical protein
MDGKTYQDGVDAQQSERKQSRHHAEVKNVRVDLNDE